MRIRIDDVLECISVEICVLSNKNVIVSCLYRPPGSAIDKLTDTIEELTLI